MKKVIQNPTGFQVVDSFVLEDLQYFSPEELPTAEQMALRAAYLQALIDLQAILDTPNTPIIDTLPKAQIAIRQLIVACQQISDIEMKELKYHKVERTGMDV